MDIYREFRAHIDIYGNLDPFSAIQNWNLTEYYNVTTQKQNIENTHKGEVVNQHNVIVVLVVSVFCLTINYWVPQW